MARSVQDPLSFRLETKLRHVIFHISQCKILGYALSKHHAQTVVQEHNSTDIVHFSFGKLSKLRWRGRVV